jgi:aspartate/methionine/tyrosine aminotransferase
LLKRDHPVAFASGFFRFTSTIRSTRVTDSPPGIPSSPRTAKRLDALLIEGSFRVGAESSLLEARGKEIIQLAFGEPDFPAPSHIVEAAIRALREGATKYAPPPGIAPLRAALASAARARGIVASPEEILVTSGAKPMLQYAAFAVVQEGDDVLVPDSGFPIYPSLVRLAGGVPVRYPIVRQGDGYALDADALAAAVTPRTRAIWLNSPHNPTGWVATASELEAVAKLALEHDLWVITDEIYHGLTYGAPGAAGAPSIAALPGLKERTIVIDGFSKRYAMTGFRLGFGIVPRRLTKDVTALIINNTSCAPHFVQRAGLAALEGPQDCIAEFRDAFRARRDTFTAALGAIPGVIAPRPAGAFYAFADVRGALARAGISTGELATRLLHEFGVAALPGTDFGPGGEGFLRFSFASAPPLLARAAERVSRCITSLAPAAGIEQHAIAESI